MLILCFAYYRHRKRGSTQEVVSPSVPEDGIPVDEKSADGSNVPQPQSPIDASASTPIKVNAVYLFGDFQVFDAKGNEIAYRFGPK